MSQHHLTVSSLSGRQAQLIAGWDWPTRCFFLELTDTCFPEDSDEAAKLSGPEFDALLMGCGDFKSMVSLERKLYELLVPFGDDDVLGLNPQLLDLLADLVLERDSPRPQPEEPGYNKLRFWDQEPEAVAHTPAYLAAVAAWYAKLAHAYSLLNPHPTYSEVNWHRYCQEMPVRLLCPYQQWVTNLVFELERPRR